MSNAYKILVSCAHHDDPTSPQYDPGTIHKDAEGRTWREAEWSRELCARIVERLADAGATVTLLDYPLDKTIREANRVYPGAALLIEPHLNAPAPKDASREYGAVIVSGRSSTGSTSRAFAAEFASQLVAARKAEGWPQRVESWQTGTAAYPRNLGLLDKTTVPAVITESAFLGTYGGALWCSDTLERIAQAHVQAARVALRRAAP